MADNVRALERARAAMFGGSSVRPPQPEAVEAPDTDEDACPAYGYLRGLHDRAVVVEFRLRDGNRFYCPYSWLGPFAYNPSIGILLRFTGDTVTLVLIRGSNLDAPVRQNAVNLTDRGLQRHRITFVREMDAPEIRRAGEGEPTIDRIEIAEFESHDDLRAWLTQHAPVFARQLQSSSTVR